MYHPYIAMREQAHWGSTDSALATATEAGPALAKTSLLNVTQRKRGVPSLLNASVTMAPGVAASDVETWSAKFWPSDGVRYRWTDGLPDRISGPGARSGVYTTQGTFRLHVPSHNTAAAKEPGTAHQDELASQPVNASADPFTTTTRKLRLYTGLFNYGNTPNSEGSYTNSATLRVSSTSAKKPINATVTHMDGNNNDSVNTCFEVVFTGDLTLTWSLDPVSMACGQLITHYQSKLRKHLDLRRVVLPAALVLGAQPKHVLNPA